MTPPRTIEAPAHDVSILGSSQLRSRVLGRDEHNVMLALGLVRAAQRTLLTVEPQILRAGELLDRIDTPRETAIVRGDLAKLSDEIARALDGAVFDGHPLFEGESAVFEVEDTRRNGDPLRVALPDLGALVHAEGGLAEFVSRRRSRAEAVRMADVLRSGLNSGKDALREAEQQLSVLLTHFHRQRSEHPRDIATDSDLARTAARLGEHVVRAGTAALATQGELSTRASSLVLHDRATH